MNDRQPRPPRIAMKSLAWTSALIVLAATPGCQGEKQPNPTGSAATARKNVTEIEPSLATFAPKAGQTIYVPVYTSVSVSDRPHNFNLAINLSVRNTDQKAPIILKSVRYIDDDGTPVREFTPKPLKVGPLASAHFYVNESDNSGGRGACFLIDWIADQPVTDAMVESVMVGTANTQGVSFTCNGRVLTDIRHP